MKKYKIIGKTNGWIASRDIHFNGRPCITLSSNLTLKEAQRKLLEYFNSDYEQDLPKPMPTWGHARRSLASKMRGYVVASFKDGTRSYEYDSRYYSIEPQNDQEESTW